jgi:hypothetical protein
LLDHPRPELRGWAIRLGLEQEPRPATFLTKLAELAGKEAVPAVRLELASALQRLAPAERWPVAEQLVRHGEDATDANLPLLLWYGIEPLVPADRNRALGLLDQARIPLVQEFLARRLVHLDKQGVSAVTTWLSKRRNESAAGPVVRGVQEALTGRREVPMPASWPAASAQLAMVPDPEVRERALILGALFGDRQALDTLRKVLVDAGAPVQARQNALQALLQKKSADLVPSLQALLSDVHLRGSAIRGLASFADENTPRVLLQAYPSLTEEEKADAIQTLASRTSYALALAEAVERDQIPRRDLSPFTVRQMLGLKNSALTAKLNKAWGVIRPASQEKRPQMARYRKLLTPDALQSADPSRGRLLFAKTCGACHRLFDDGGSIGPDLTGSQRMPSCTGSIR